MNQNPAITKPLQSNLHILILQHPQEPDHELGTAPLAHSALSNSTLRVGLSWPNLKTALKNPSIQEVSPKKWGVLYLGSGIKGGIEPAEIMPGSLHWVNRQGVRLPDAEQKKIKNELYGLITLDGTWSQAKAIWWRNPWLLKLNRAILIPQGPSLYGRLRKEPRRECVSTLESIADCLTLLGESPELAQALKEKFKEFLRNHQRKKY